HQEVAAHHQREADGHLHGPRALDDREHEVEEGRHHQDVDAVAQHEAEGAVEEDLEAAGEGGHEVEQQIRHARAPPRAMARATSIAWRIGATSWTRTAWTPA